VGPNYKLKSLVCHCISSPKQDVFSSSFECHRVVDVGEQLSPAISLDDEKQTPQFYTVKHDGVSGVELLRHRDVADYLAVADRDPDSVVLTEKLPDCDNVACITVLRHISRNPSETWLCPYTHDTVVPPGLRVSTASLARTKVSSRTVPLPATFNPVINPVFPLLYRAGLQAT